MAYRLQIGQTLENGPGPIVNVLELHLELRKRYGAPP